MKLGIQIDLNVVASEEGEKSLCNHNCTTDVGGYTCPSAFTLNKGLKPKYASKEQILTWVDLSAEGLKRYAEHFFSDIGDVHRACKNIGISPKKYIKQYNREGVQIEVNLFGGNPEMHPEILPIISSLKSKGYIVNFTTTGRRVLKDSAFLEELEKDQPHIIALSADDLDLGMLKALGTKTPEEIKQIWKTVPATHGQKQKAFEALYTALTYTGTVLFNVVLHPGNIDSIIPYIEELHRIKPDAIINPFPFQDSFSDSRSTLDQNYLDQLLSFVSWVFREKPPYLSQRLHYWIVLRSAFLKYKNDPKTLWDKITGSLWKCYKSPYTGYLQIGKGPPSSKGTGGKIGCYWNNQTITEEKEIVSSLQVEDYLIDNTKHKRSAEASSPCSGCIMPRLMSDELTTYLGLDL